MKFRCFWLLILPCIAACTANTLHPQIEGDIAKRLQADGYSLSVLEGDKRLLRGESSRDGGVFIKNGQQTGLALYRASQGAGAVGSGAASAGIIIGSLVASQLTKSNAESEQQDEAEQRVAPLRQALNAQPIQHWYADAYQHALHKGGAAARETGAMALSLAPQALLAQDLQSVRLITEARLTLGRATVYQGRIEVISRPLVCTDDCLDIWSHADGQRYKAALKSNIEETTRVLLLDWQSQHFAETNTTEQTLRYQIGQSRYVERGRLVDTSGDRHVFLGLRGWLKSVPLTEYH